MSEKLHFNKYQGTGNDFVIIDNRDRRYDHLDVAKLCHPKFGIGGDGLMLLQSHQDFDFEMVYYNSDGKISSMCGNGGRCIVDFAKKYHVFEGQKTRFIAIDGPHDAIWHEDEVELKMMDVNQWELRGRVVILNTGSPHYVVFSDDVNAIDIMREAGDIRYDQEFRDEGINVNFVELLSTHHLRVRTYERGVEAETLSCGTGVTACSLAYAISRGMEDGQHETEIETPGGRLRVKYTKSGNQFTDIWLCGPATEVYEGTMGL